ncbi:MAG: TlpA disulfide reductase family protein [Terriglobia bacterium]
MEEQTPIDNTPEESKAPESSPSESPPAPKSKILVGALLAMVLVVGLYYVNRYWIEPAVRAQTKGDGSHPVAPPFSLTDITGQPLNLSDYKGKVVVLDFWATWCGPCRIEIPGFIELQKRYASQGFTMIGISMDDSPEPVVDFTKELQMNYPVAVGNDRLGELYGGMPGLPTTFVIGRDGRIYAKHVGATDASVFETEIKELLAASPADEATDFHRAGQVFAEDKVELGDPATIDSEVPGIDLTKLTADQKEAFKKLLAGQQCTCGCKFTLLKCRQVDRNCSTSKKLAKDQMDAFLKVNSTGVATK